MARLGWALLLAVGIAPPSRAQSLDELRNELRRAAESTDVAEGFAALVNYGVAPDLSSVTLRIEEDGEENRLDTFKLPLSREFRRSDRDWYPFVEGALGYTRYDETERLDLGNLGTTKFKGDYRMYSGVVAGGAGVELPFGLELRPVIGFGLSRLRNDGTFSDTVGKTVVRRLVQGIITDYDLWAASVLGGIGMRYRTGDEEGRSLELKLRYTHGFTSSFDETDEAQHFKAQTDTLVARAEFFTPTDGKLAGVPLGVVFSTGGTVFLADGRVVDEMVAPTADAVLDHMKKLGG